MSQYNDSVKDAKFVSDMIEFREGVLVASNMARVHIDVYITAVNGKTDAEALMLVTDAYTQLITQVYIALTAAIERMIKQNESSDFNQN